ncbi:MAG: polyprenyl synthetase family protein [Parahaliea sp.]
MSAALSSTLAQLREQIERELSAVIDASTAALPPLQAAARHSLISGGKRVRPVLVIAACRAVNTNAALALPAAACTALELVHTYSLIHDDLPAMDDDDLRRGVPTLHKAFDEATAILVGDGLQTLAFEQLADAPGLSDAQKVAMIRVLAQTAGFGGMVGGQYVDVQSEGKEIGLAELKSLHAMKTGALIQAAVALGAIAGGASQAQLASLDDYASHIGLAFQVVDDILDVEGDTATLGKTQGKDEAADKATYVKFLGLEGAKNKARQLLATALTALESFDESANLLRDIARYIIERDY